MGRVSLTYEKKRLVQGLALLAMGILAPLAINERSLGIYRSLERAMAGGAPLYLLHAALKLVLMNSVRALPHYLGAFLLSESVSLEIRGRRRFSFNAVFTFALIWLIYQVIEALHGIRYDFGVPALITVAFVLLLSYMNLFSVSVANKLVSMTTLLLSIQWLDVVPELSRRGFGRGEISGDVKSIAVLMGWGELLDWFAVTMCIAFLIGSSLQVQLLYKEHKLRMTTLKNQRVEQELMEAQLGALRMRSLSEVQSLVHDLKTPLTTVQGLVTLSEMLEPDPTISEYLRKISDSVTGMSTFISEILYEDRMSCFSTRVLLRSVLSQISISVPAQYLHYENSCEDALLYGNRIHLSRAIINPIDNAYRAIRKPGGQIRVRVFRLQGDVVVEIRDDGRGIAPGDLPHIWEPGFSQNHSTGLGLNFTRQVIGTHHGAIDVESRLGQYTKVTIRLREVRSDERELDE